MNSVAEPCQQPIFPVHRYQGVATNSNFQLSKSEILFVPFRFFFGTNQLGLSLVVRRLTEALTRRLVLHFSKGCALNPAQAGFCDPVAANLFAGT
jgi:hypothetical protein